MMMFAIKRHIIFGYNAPTNNLITIKNICDRSSDRRWRFADNRCDRAAAPRGLFDGRRPPEHVLMSNIKGHCGVAGGGFMGSHAQHV